MKIIEPCCAQRHVKELRSAIKNGGTVEFMGYGDMSLTELLPALMTRYSETEMLIAAPSIPDQAAEAIARCMGRQWSRADGQGKLDVVSHLTIIADLSPEKSPAASGWLEDNPFGGRLTLVGKEQEDTVILLPDLAITGPVNLRYGHEFTATATTIPGEVKALWEKYAKPAVPEEPEAAEAPGPAGDAKASVEQEAKESAADAEPRRRNGRKAKDAPAEPADATAPADPPEPSEDPVL